MPRSNDKVGLTVYEQLGAINQGFHQIRRALAALRKVRLFHGAELQRCRDLAAETQASINSYVSHVIEEAETNRAGRLFRRRIARECKEDSGP